MYLCFHSRKDEMEVNYSPKKINQPFSIFPDLGMYCNVQIKKIITINFNNYNNFCTNYHFGKRKRRTSRHLGKNDSQFWWLRYTKTTLLYQFVFIKLQCSDKIHLTQNIRKRDNKYKMSIFHTSYLSICKKVGIL